jgi:hypothetical protein
MINHLDKPIGLMAGSEPWCVPCELLTGCDMMSIAGITEDRGFFGLCCTCQPKRVCVSLWIDPEYGCGCEADYHDPEFPVSSTEAEWDCSTNSYNGILRCVNPTWPEIDFQIGYEQDPSVDLNGGGIRSGNCYIVLRSAALGYTFEDRIGSLNDGTDNRIWVPAGGEYHDSAIRRNGCSNLGYEFEVDLFPIGPAYDGPCSRAIIKIDKTDHVCRSARVSGFWDGENICYYNRACITYNYTPEDPEEEVIHLTQNVCLNAEDDVNYIADFENVEDVEKFSVIVNIVGNDPITMLQLGARVNDYGIYLDQGLYPVEAECPYMYYKWILDSGAEVSIKGDQRADCNDCNCWCRTICVTYYNDSLAGVFQGELSWDEEYNVWHGELYNNLEIGYPVGISIGLECDECDKVTVMKIATAEKEITAQVDCDEIDVSVSYQNEDDSNTYIYISCKKCLKGCFTPFNISIPCCPDNPLPNTLSLTIEPDVADYDPGPPPLPGAGSCTGANDVIILTHQGSQPGGGFIDEWWGSGFPFSGCPSKRINFRLRCRAVDGYNYQWQLSVDSADDSSNGEYDSEFVECDPLEIVFNKIQIGSTNSCCEPSEIVDTINNYKGTVTI